jgi:hypothetical protein
MNSKLDWVRNYKGHDSTAQNSIWHCIMMLSDFETVKVVIDGFEPENITNGEKDFHTFMKTLYQDMYANPGKYAIPFTEYDEYIKTINIEEYYGAEHKISDAKEGRLRQEFQNAIQFYPDYFYQLGLKADEICNKDYILVISKSKYDSILKSLSQPKNEQRINALSNMGILITELGETCYISSIQFPKMFLGLRILCSMPESTYKYMNYLRLDYKGYYRAVPDINDIKATMDKEHADILNLLCSLLDNPKIKIKLHPLGSITSNNKWKVRYILDGKCVFQFYAGPAYFCTHIFFRDTEHFTNAIKLLTDTDSTLFEWLNDKFRERTGCAGRCPKNKAVMFGNQERRICGSTNQIELFFPNEDDVKKSFALMGILDEI